MNPIRPDFGWGVADEGSRIPGSVIGIFTSMGQPPMTRAIRCDTGPIKQPGFQAPHTQDSDMAREIGSFEQGLIELIKPLGTAKWQADYRWDKIEGSLEGLGDDYGGLELIPDFQRGHVWSKQQQVHFVENCLRGVVASNGFLIQFNCASWNENAKSTDLPPGLQCVDGLQRFTAITAFVKGEVKPFGLSIDDLKGSQFHPSKFYMKVSVHTFASRVDLLSHYLAINSGGTQHSNDEIARVRGLLDQAKAA
jgi:hypothetical protein